MKKLIVSLIILLLLVIAFFQFKKYTRLNAPHQYDYTINPNIDNNYFDQKLVSDYYKISYDIGTFAREQWYNYKIDVLYQDNSSERSRQATIAYDKMRATVKRIEGKLLQSAQLKKEGFSNHAIRSMFENGYSVEEYKIQEQFGDIQFKEGDRNNGVKLIQQRLNKKGYPMKIDGIFDAETEDAVMRFQEKNGLYPTGVVEKSTLLLLLNHKNN